MSLPWSSSGFVMGPYTSGGAYLSSLLVALRNVDVFEIVSVGWGNYCLIADGVIFRRWVTCPPD